MQEFSAAHFTEVLEALHQDQTCITVALEDVKKIADAWWWATEGRGSYEWDDDRYQEEFRHCLTQIIERIDQAFGARNKAHELCCGRYRHLGPYKKEPFQMRLNFGMAAYEDYADFVQDTLKIAALEL